MILAEKGAHCQNQTFVLAERCEHCKNKTLILAERCAHYQNQTFVLAERGEHCKNKTLILAERYEHLQNETLTLRCVFDTVDPKCMCFTIVIFGFDGKTEGFWSIIPRNPRVPWGIWPRVRSVKPLNTFGESKNPFRQA